MWLSLALICMVLLAGNTLCEKWAVSRNIPVVDFVTGRMLFKVVLILVVWWALMSSPSAAWSTPFLQRSDEAASLATPESSSMTLRQHCRLWWGWPQIVSGILQVAVGLIIIVAFHRAPNPGYVLSVVSTSAVLVAMLSPWLFASTSLSGQGMLGIALIVIGVCVVGTCST